MTTSIIATGTDWAPECNLHLVARDAAELGERIREEDLREIFDDLQEMAHRQPAKTAQLIMCFAAWFNPDDTTETLTRRAESITQARVARALA